MAQVSMADDNRFALRSVAGSTEGTKVSMRVKTTRMMHVASLASLCSWVMVLISFASPYWLSSYQYSYSPFVRLGLWDFCFRDYRHPPYQYDEKFNGCYYIYSAKYQNIRDWLQPGWFIFVQAMMSIALTLSICCLITLAIILMYYFVRYQVGAIATAFALQAATALPLLLSVIVFGIMAFDRSWLLYPPYNHLDWAYYVAIGALVLSVLASALLFFELVAARERRRKFNNLVYNMQPRF